MDLKLKGLRAFVAGSSRGLGYAAAYLLAQEGAQVTINSRDPLAVQAAAKTILDNTGVQVFPIAGDVTDPAVPAQLIEQAVQAMGGLDILITNSGGPPAGKFENIEDAAWEKAVELTLMSHVRLIRAALPHLRKSAAPSVLTITSYSVKQPIPNLVLSNSVRAATVGLTKTLALELGADRIRFNSILPGWTETERVYDLLQARAQSNHTSVEDEMQKQTADVPLGRMGKPDEFANVAVFLVSPAAAYVNGAMLTVDGGITKGTL